MSPIIVVGATGIMRPLAVRLVGAGAVVIGVARSADQLAAMAAELGRKFVPVRWDTTGPGLIAALGKDLVHTDFGAAVAYGPAVGEESMKGLRAVTAGPVVQLLTSDVARPLPGEEAGGWPLDRLSPAPGLRRLVLGWSRAGRWHSPAEVSTAALDLMQAPQDEDRLLGVVRPWKERP